MVFVIKSVYFVFYAVRHHKAVPVQLGLAGSGRYLGTSDWCHLGTSVWCHYAGLVSLLEPALLPWELVPARSLASCSLNPIW